MFKDEEKDNNNSWMIGIVCMIPGLIALFVLYLLGIY